MILKDESTVLNEIVLDVESLLKSLSTDLFEHMIKADSTALQSDMAGGEVKHFSCRSNKTYCNIKAKHYILAAGAGNQSLFDHWGHFDTKMIERPLHMVAVKK